MAEGIRIQLSPELAQKFRKSAMEMYGYGKGALSEAAGAALEEWVKKIEILRGRRERGSATDRITGLLKDLPQDSVMLQHLGTKLLGKTAGS